MELTIISGKAVRENHDCRGAASLSNNSVKLIVM